ncbi:MAG TPA: isopentenyl-diphosphate Delta-isomerase [Candidatus Saccharimonadales bacterium]|nr:isopentenyl-diphosphate Delta-isomerase [Candidatus Saccharimonadales bacterium]
MSTAQEELIILVDEQDNQIGTAPKLASHHQLTPLHRAFSCFVFDDAGRFLVTRRARSKKVFPGIWTNSCCGHPAPGEPMAAAIQRRLQFELGMRADQIKIALPDFRYTARYRKIVENELCPVYLARTSEQPKSNPAEVADWLWLPWAEWLDEIKRRPWRYSTWSRKETGLLTALPQLGAELGLELL